MEILDTPQQEVDFINDDAKNNIRKSAVWMKVYSISSLVILGLFLLLMLFALSTYWRFFFYSLNSSVFYVLILSVLLFSAAYVILMIFIIKASNKRTDYSHLQNLDRLIESYIQLKKFWRGLGIMIIAAILYILIFTIILSRASY